MHESMEKDALSFLIKKIPLLIKMQNYFANNHSWQSIEVKPKPKSERELQTTLSRQTKNTWFAIFTVITERAKADMSNLDYSVNFKTDVLNFNT